jgi:uroporphyrinogen-III synthase
MSRARRLRILAGFEEVETTVLTSAMTESLNGARVALLEARRESELASLVSRHGGEPVRVPAMREVERECSREAALGIDATARDGTVVVLATGVGLDRWLRIATALGRDAELRDGLARSTVVCRGPKPVAVLKREGLQAHLRAPPPHTTTELLALLATIEVRDRDAVYVQDGGGSAEVADVLARRGARTVVIRPYGWALPEEVAPLRDLVRAIASGEVAALAVTTQVQAVNLFEVAAEMGKTSELRSALGGRVVLAAIGPTSARALERLGVPPHVVPEQSKMGPLVLALARYLAAAAGDATAASR